MPSLKYYDLTSGTYKYVTGGMSQAAADARYMSKASVFCDVVQGAFTGAPGAFTWNRVNPINPDSTYGGFTVSGGLVTVPLTGRYQIDFAVGVSVGQHYVEGSLGSASAAWAGVDSYFGIQNYATAYGMLLGNSRAYLLTAGQQIGFWLQCSAANKSYTSLLAKLTYLGYGVV